jgi:DNA gyrase inhibitor GyrI
MLKDNDTKIAMEIFEHNLLEINDEINALSNISQVIASFIERLNVKKENFSLLGDKNLLESVNSITVSNLNFKEEYTVEILNKAGEKLKRLTDRDVRIIYIPPATVASIHHIGCTNAEIPESTTGVMVRDFIKNNNLAKTKPDLRHYGLNHPDKPHNSDEHGYERLVTIPENMVVPEPFTKKQFSGGLYAAYTITGEDWEECPLLWDWVKNSEKYEFNFGAPECMNGVLEEYLNHINLNISSDKYYSEVWQIDILIPVKEK